MKRFGLIVIVIVLSMVAIPAMAQSTSDSDSNAVLNYEPYYEGTETRREFPNAVSPGMPGSPQFFGDALMTHEYSPLNKLFEVMPEWGKADVENFLKPEDFENTESRARSFGSFNATEQVKVTYMRLKPENYEQVGFHVVNTCERGTPVEAVVARLMDHAMNAGANVAIRIDEGAKRVLHAQAFGAALGYSHFTVSGGPQKNAGAGTAGIGFTKGKTEYNHEPWARFALVRVPENLYNQVSLYPPDNGKKVKQSLEDEVERLIDQKMRQIMKEQAAE